MARELEKTNKQVAKELTFRNRMMAGMTPEESSKGIVSPKNIDTFIENMSPIVKAGFLEIAPTAQNRLLDLLYAKKQIVDKGQLVEVDDNDSSIKAAEMIFKYSGIADKPVAQTSGPKKASIMDAIIS